MLLPGNRPALVSATRRDLVGQATHYCREGDARWRPVEELNAHGKAPGSPRERPAGPETGKTLF